MEKISKTLSKIAEGFMGAWPFLRKKFEQHCKQKNIHARIFILRLIFEMAMIDDSIFNVIYHGKVNRKPKSPGLLFRMLIAKEILNLSDQRLIDEMKVNVELRLLIGVAQTKDVPCRETLSRFRRKLREYYEQTGENLAEKIINSLIQATNIQNLELGSRIVYRIDSTLVDAFLRESNRLGLFYLTLRAFVKSLDKNNLDFPEQLKHYTCKGEYNLWFYRKRNKEFTQAYWKIILDDLETVLAQDSRHFSKSPYYKILLRLVEEQTCLDENGKLKLKDPKKIKPNSLQSHLDPQATCRIKDKLHIGYVVNFVEMVALNEKGEIIAQSIVYYQLEQNTYSDIQFLKDFLENYEAPEEPCELVCDGAYYSEENSKLAQEKNFILCPTDLTGKKPDPIMKDFILSDDGKEVLTCPNKQVPRSQSYNESTEQIRASFAIETCQNCPLKDKCNPKTFVRVAVKIISRKTVNRARIIEQIGTKSYQKLAHIRNGVESIPSQLKNTYKINKIRQHGLFHASMESGLKILALSITKLTNAWIEHCFPKMEF